MANCHKCWWADYHPDAPTKHVIHEEPDYLQMKGPFSEAPMIRIVQSCGKGQTYFKTHGAQDHDCPKFELPDKHQASLDKEVAAIREEWSHPTSRKKMEAGQNALAALSVMQEGSDDAYNYLIDLMFFDLEAFTEIVTGLDDMNIRGHQLAMVFDYYDRDVAKVRAFVHERDVKVIRWINKVYAKSNEEEAVQRGAHLYGHKESNNAGTRKPNNIKRVGRRSAATNIRVRHKIVSELRRGDGTGADDLP